MISGVSRALVREHARERQAWEAERKNLLDRIMYLADKPWTGPPVFELDQPERGRAMAYITDDPGPEVLQDWMLPE